MQIKNEENGTFIQDNLENELDRVNVETGNSEDESEKSQVDYLDINEENWLIIIYYNNLLFNNMNYWIKFFFIK